MNNLKFSDIVSLGIILMFMASLSPRSLFYTQEEEKKDEWNKIKDEWMTKAIKGYTEAQNRMWQNWKKTLSD